MTYEAGVLFWRERLEDIRQYNIELEDYLCHCLSLFAQHDIAPPEAPDRVAAVLREKFLNAVKGKED